MPYSRGTGTARDQPEAPRERLWRAWGGEKEAKEEEVGSERVDGEGGEGWQVERWRREARSGRLLVICILDCGW